VAFFQIRGSWYVQLRDADDRVLLRSQELGTEPACRLAAAKIRLAATIPERYEERCSTHGGHYFVLRDDSGEVLAISPIHPTKASCAAAMEEVRESAIRAINVASMRQEIAEGGTSPGRDKQ
jgi:uncharacterized protein YegP (UPF0339 family)